MLEWVKNPIVYFFVMMVVLSAASLPPSAPTMMAAKANAPWLLATLAAGAAGIAAVFDYYLVRRVFRIDALDRVRRHRLFERAEHWAKVAPFVTVVAFAALPLPFMIPRVLVPLSGYSTVRYAVAVAIGRFPRIFVLATFGQIFELPNWMLEALFAGALALGAITAILRKLGWIGARAPGPAAPPREGEAPRDDAPKT